jgi:hypothetical protein
MSARRRWLLLAFAACIAWPDSAAADLAFKGFAIASGTGGHVSRLSVSFKHRGRTVLGGIYRCAPVAQLPGVCLFSAASVVPNIDDPRCADLRCNVIPGRSFVDSAFAFEVQSSTGAECFYKGKVPFKFDAVTPAISGSYECRDAGGGSLGDGTFGLQPR